MYPHLHPFAFIQWNPQNTKATKQRREGTRRSQLFLSQQFDPQTLYPNLKHRNSHGSHGNFPMEKSPAAGGARDPELFGGIQDLSEGQLVEARHLDEFLDLTMNK